MDKTFGAIVAGLLAAIVGSAIVIVGIIAIFFFANEKSKLTAGLKKLKKETSNQH